MGNKFTRTRQHQHYYVNLYIGDSLYPFDSDTKTSICLILKGTRCFSYIVSKQHIFLYVKTSTGVTEKTFFERVKRVLDITQWKMMDTGQFSVVFDQGRFLESVPLDHIQDESYRAQRWVLTAGTLRSEDMWDPRNAVLFELDPIADSAFEMQSQCFGLVFTMQDKTKYLEARIFLSSKLSIYLAESVDIAGLIHMCVRLNKRRSLKFISNVFGQWNEMHPSGCMVLIRGADCCHVIDALFYTDSPFYRYCVSPATHNLSRRIWV